LNVKLQKLLLFVGWTILILFTLLIAAIIISDSIHAPPIVSGHSAEILPNKRLTPGQTDPMLTKDKLCSRSFRTGTVRNVDDSLKRRVMIAYGVKDCVLNAGKTKLPDCGKVYEFDHLISIEIGGNNKQANIWPQRLAGIRGAHVKDGLENRLHSLVCHGKLPLQQAQHEIAANWIVAYNKYLKRR